MSKGKYASDNISIGQAAVEDLPAVLALLEKSGLPKDGIAEHLVTMLVAREGKRIVGSAGLELYEKAALLRSVAVDKSLRGQGIGQQLTRSALDLALKHGATTVYLLTETASEFFSRFGFKPISRSQVPPFLQQSVEFTSACPTSALVMMMRLGQLNRKSHS